MDALKTLLALALLSAPLWACSDSVECVDDSCTTTDPNDSNPDPGDDDDVEEPPAPIEPGDYDDPIERLDLRPFTDEQRLPELAPGDLDTELRPLAEQINRLRDRIDEELFGYQDYGLVATKPKPAPGT